MNPIVAPAHRLLDIMVACALLSCFTTYVLTTYECKAIEGMPQFKHSKQIRCQAHSRFYDSVPPDLLCALVVWECIRESRFHDEQRVSDNRKRVLISSILVIVSVVTMFGIGAMSTPKPFRHMAECFSWGYDVAKSACDDVTPMPAMLTKHKEGYLFDAVGVQLLSKLLWPFPSGDYQRCTYVANHRNNMILLVLYWCHLLSVICHTAEILIRIVCGLLSALNQWAHSVENVRSDEEPSVV